MVRGKRLVAQAQEIIEPHQPTHPLGVDDEPFALQLLGDPAIAVEPIRQCDTINRIANWASSRLESRGQMTIITGSRQLGELNNAELHASPSGRAHVPFSPCDFSAALESRMSA